MTDDNSQGAGGENRGWPNQYYEELARHEGYLRSPNPPAFRAPPIVLWLLGILTLVHVIQRWFLSDDTAVQLLAWFAFIPARYTEGAMPPEFHAGWVADLVPFVSYAFIHADFTHLFINAVWLLAFGSPVAARLGATRFLSLYLFCAVFAALMHFAFHVGDFVPVVGASGAISGLMGAAARFVFQPGASLVGFGASTTSRVPRLPLLQVIGDRRVFIFIAIWVGLNLLFGLAGMGFGGEARNIAWEAHLGGFAAGLIAFGAFDPLPKAGKHSFF